MIKPIETVYKGYRFRSRLEARWAVFFDTLGLKWEYEKEGFDINGKWYLPDFYLPDLDLWIEIKPLTNGIFFDYQIKKIYLAGKISKNQWRSNILENGKIFGYFENTGPFYKHPESSRETYHGKEAFWEHGSTNDLEVYEECLEQIKAADIIFAWIDRTDCHGTLFELGYAAGIGKDILIGVDSDLSAGSGGKYSNDASEWRPDIWFCLQSAKRWEYFSSPTIAFYNLTAYLKRIDNKVIEFSKENSILYICGTPSDQVIYFNDEYGDGIELTHEYTWFAKSSISFEEVDRALLTARQARFEHGERG